ncbi:MarR family winged helix-turn-helix transcriptional regulator [Acidimangrovimonas sediminis]|uniref:MarR family winged helix-turn-helix transcriptional regulator n=1 Tax=Acidimangrovimonas sediminis TaxID=2056283 RepID=UPI001304B828|nr:MarR family transcriptional regulator [Acidimangrovimonas sediminis]
MADHIEEKTSFAPLLIAVAQSWRREIARELAREGLSDATALPIVHLLRDGDGIRQTELARRVGVENTALVRILDVLERDGYIRRDSDPTDRRAKLVYLTERGQAPARHASDTLQALRGRLLVGIAPEDLAVTERVLEKILSALYDETAS